MQSAEFTATKNMVTALAAALEESGKLDMTYFESSLEAAHMMLTVNADHEAAMLLLDYIDVMRESFFRDNEPR